MTYEKSGVGPQTGKSVPSLSEAQAQVVRDRISSAIDALGGLKAASAVAGVTDEQLARWRDGKSKPSFFGVLALCKEAGISLDWVGGLQDAGALRPLEVSGGDGPTDLTLIPRYDVRLSSGRGALIAAEEIFEHLAFRTSWLREMGIAPQDAALVTNDGDSNEPTIPDGALMLLDLSIREVSNGKFYALRRDGELLIKRIQRLIDGSIILKSDNPRYDPETIPPDRVIDLHVIGRLKWIARSI
ncbi:MAG: helix-turn-helix transcriptional regulator [Microbacterium sp.]|nr:MAG: helix-turn-helix transcriptional regulator [Microbacterium sp.]